MRTARLHEVCSFQSGGTPSKRIPAYWRDGGLPWITGADITGNTVTESRSYITKEGLDSSAATVVPAGTVLLVTRTGVGKAAIAGMELAFSQDVTALKPSSDLDARYLLRYLRSQADYFTRSARGATIRGIPQELVSRLTVPLPSVSEQRRIAAVLDQVDKLRAKRRKAIALLDEHAQSIFLDMFGDASEWPMGIVADVANRENGSIRTGPFGSQLLHEEFVAKGVAVLGIDNAVNNEFSWTGRRFITGTKYDQLKRYTVCPDDVLITIMGTCGRCAIVPQGIPTAINTKHLCCITLDQSVCLPRYLHAYFLRHIIAQRYLARSTKGAIMAGLNMEIIKRMPIPIPPLELQYEYASRVAVIERAKESQHAHLAKLDVLFASLQARAFRGEL